MSVEDSESRRFESNIWLSFSQADLGPTFAQFFFLSLIFFPEDLCSYRAVQKSYGACL